MINAFNKYIVNPQIIKFGKKIEEKHFDKKPILIVGTPRSGTTLLLSILSANPTLFSVLGETYAFDCWKLVNEKEIPPRIDSLYSEFIIRKIPPGDRLDNTQTKKNVHWGTKVQKIYSNSLYRWKNTEHADHIKEFMQNKDAVNLLNILKYD